MSSLSALVASRQEDLAGIFVAITRQCPFVCDHCSTRSFPKANGEIKENDLIRFFETIASSKENKPRHVVFTGGEALLRSNSIEKVLPIISSWGGSSHIYSGGFFGRPLKLAKPYQRIFKKISTISLSWDKYHQPWISNFDFKRAVEFCKNQGLSVSIQFTKVFDDDDHELEKLERDFPDISVFAASLGPIGRAKDNRLVPDEKELVPPDTPCTQAAWPTISYFGKIIACCNQEMIDSNSTHPAHLYLGNIADSTWSDVVKKRESNNILRTIQTLGPASIAQDIKINSQCGTCIKILRPELPKLSDGFVSVAKDLRKDTFKEKHLISKSCSKQ